ncbi:MAG: alpha/beta hydrolase [Candidatus Paceibacterota bacterium]
METVVFLIHGWSGNPEKSLVHLQETLEMIPGIRVLRPIHGLKGPFSRVRARKNISYHADVVEQTLKEIPEDAPIIAVGHSMGALILRLLYNRGHRFEEMIFAGGPHKGVSPKVAKLEPLARILGVTPLLEMLPGSSFLEELGSPPPGIYIGGKKDKLVPLHSSIPTNKGIVLDCGHDMFPEGEQGFATKVVVEKVLEKL